MALEVGTEYVREWRYELRMIGILIRVPCHVYVDNKSVIFNSYAPESVLKKKRNLIVYNHVQKGISRAEWRITYIDTNNKNHNYLLTKLIPCGEKRIKFCQNLLHHLFEYRRHMNRRIPCK